MKLFLFLGLMVATLSASQVAIGIASADGDEIVVLEQRAESDFPNGVRFYLSASSPDEIDDVRVIFKKLGQTSRSAYRTVDFEAGTEIHGESLIVSGSGGEYIPPGTRIEYSFDIRDTAGRELRTPDEVFVYLDTRFEWQTISEGPITLYYQKGGLEGRAREMLAAADETLDRMGPILGIEPKDPLHIVTYDNYSDMVDALPFRAQAVRNNLITQGTAFSEERVLLVLSGDSAYIDTTSHEFIHLLVADATGRALSRVPAWLNEGLAEYGNIVETDEYEGFLNRAIENGELRPLWHQNTFSGTPTDILAAYGQGESVVQFLQATYGEEKMADLLKSLKTNFDIDTALMETYGIDQYGLDSEWRKSRGLEPLPPPEERVTEPQPTTTQPPAPAPASTEAPTSTPAGAPESGLKGPEASPPASPGCNAPIHGGPVASDLAVLLLLGAPLAMLGVRRIRRRGE